MNSKILKWGLLALSIGVCSVFFTNCGSSSSSSPATPPTDNSQSGGTTLWQGGTLQSLTAIQGTWIQGRCVAISGGSVKTFYKVSATAVDKVNLSSGNLFYSGNSACSGTPTNLGDTNIGETTFVGTDDYGSKKYYYGTLKMISGLEQNYVYALKNSTTICIFHRTSDLVSAQDVNEFVAATNAVDCYSK